jgi:hypothetical protein
MRESGGERVSVVRALRSDLWNLPPPGGAVPVPVPVSVVLLLVLLLVLLVLVSTRVVVFLLATLALRGVGLLERDKVENGFGDEICHYHGSPCYNRRCVDNEGDAILCLI